MRGMKVPKSLVLSLILLSGVALANWQLDLWKGGIWSDGKNITVEGNITAKGDLSGVDLRLSGDIYTSVESGATQVSSDGIVTPFFQVGNWQIIGLGSRAVADGTSSTITIAGTLPGDFSLSTLDNVDGTSATIYSSRTTTDSVVIALSADPATTYTVFSKVYRLVD